MTVLPLYSTFVAVLIVIAGVVMVVRQVDVRLALFVCGLALATLAGRPLAAFDKFTDTMVNASFVVPICCSMGFAFVLKFTGCDTHLVRLLVTPLRRAGPLVVPGAVFVPFIVNTAITSQSSTAATVGPVLVPLLLAAGLSPGMAGTALLIGSSVGGELLNAGAPEVAAIAKTAGVPTLIVIERMLLPSLLVAGTAAAVFWRGLRRPDPKGAVAKGAPIGGHPSPPARCDLPLAGSPAPDVRPAETKAPESPEPERINLFKAAIPLLPVVLLVLDARLPHHLFPRPVDLTTWKEWTPIGYSMLIGTGLAMLTSWRSFSGSAAAFFQGQGFAYTYIISLIVAALTFVEGLKQSGLMGLAVGALAGREAVVVPAAVVVPGSMALLTGSGIAPSLTFVESFLPHAGAWGVDATGLGVVAAQAAAIGRTLSPAAAVVMVCSTLTGVAPLVLLRRAAPPLLAGWLVILLLGFWLVR
jgi:C4-dicarboxylate transporter, DcuC family